MNAKKAAAMIAIKADSKSLDRDLANARKTLRAFGSDTRKIGGKIWGTGKGALKSLAGGLGLSAGMGLSEMVGDVLDYNRALTRFQVAAKKSDAEMAAMSTSITDVSRATAISRDEILGGLQTYVDLTGDVAGAGAAMSSFARIAQASGSKVSDVATATAALQVAMKLDPSQVEAVFSGLITQGEKGAVSLKDFAGELAELAPQFATFAGGTGADGIRDMGAAFQVIRTGAGSASKAATQFEALMGELVASHKKLGAIGVKVFQKDGKSLRSFADIAEDLAKNTKLDSVATLQDVFGRKESQQAVRSIRDQIGAMRELRVAGENTTAVQQNLNTVLGSSTGRVDVAINNLKLAIADAFTPERIAVFARALEAVVGAASKLASALGQISDFWNDAMVEFKNPFESQAGDVAIGLAGALVPGAGDLEQPVSANADMFREKIRSIKARGSKEDRIREAIQATNLVGDAAGGEGIRRAGREYLDRQSPAAVTEVMSKMQGDAMLSVLRNIATDLRANAQRPVEVKADGSAIAKTSANAKIHRSGGG